ncbi:winged helix-turn-helix transcriptional regulator [Paracandidimonas soli]|nr:helix-turn-helix domain-containing protein [Paracandidimonas soli]
MVNQLQTAQHLRLPEKHQRILEMHDRGTTQREIAHRVSASLSTVNAVINRYRVRGEA